MTLYLVQHAEAVNGDEDAQRFLTERGRVDIEKTARFASESAEVSVRSIVHSGKLRARQTAEVLAAALSPPDGVCVAEGLSPMADTSDWVDRLELAENDTMIVGHLPHLSRLTAQLVCGDPNRSVVHFRNAGIVCLVRKESGNWSLLWTVIPDILV